MSKTAMPKSKAKTAYGLLSEVRRLILASPNRYDQRECYQKTECGTVCCVGGWIVMLKAPRTHDGHRLNRAERILGLNWLAAGELWFRGAAGDRLSIREHARRGAAHIARFQKKYAAQLKAKRV